MRFLSRVARNPTLLSLVLAMAMLFYAVRPWLKPQTGVPWEWQWGMMLIAVCLAGALLHPRRWMGWLAVVLAMLAFGRGWPWNQNTWAGGLTELKWLLESAAQRFCPTIGLLVFIAGVAVIGAMAVKGAEKDLPGDVALARAFIAAAVSLAVWDPVDYFGLSILRPMESGPLLRTVVSLLPVVVFASLLWNLWRGIMLWIGAIVASLALVSVFVLEYDRLKIGDLVVITVALLAGPMWALHDWRRSRQAIGLRGFEVMLTDAVRPVSPQ